ncbi:hypothetical protein [Microbispora sp. NPDC046933]|uniref:hypothetical protein n=1 Tax=Microbispora sp. NPDC046933 TaxID=3155618 RepID=UPI00340587F0
MSTDSTFLAVGDALHALALADNWQTGAALAEQLLDKLAEGKRVVVPCRRSA